MAENTRPPIAVRIVRPYETEDTFLESELETVGKTSVILIGAHARPAGVILRFEVTLASGATVLRGEGRVLAHKENAFRGQAGLALRFTRLDPKSKALVDRAAAIREARLARDSGIPPAPPTPNPPSVPPPLPSSAQPRSVPPPLRISATPPPLPASASVPPRRPSVPPPLPASASAPPPPGRASVPPTDAVIAEVLTSPTPDPSLVAAEAPRSVRPSPAGPVALAAMRAILAEGAEDEPFQPVPPPPSDASLSAAVPADPESVPPGAPEVVLVQEAAAEPALEPEAPEPPAGEPSPEDVVEVSSAEISTVDASAVEASSPEPSAPEPSAQPPAAAPPAAEPPGSRESVLERLRRRAAGLSDEQKAALLRR